ncbi:hypothetical protein LCGC14_0392660 [marine sediment metagenome]|uniref:Uncharacterized protein n=1 Tax=marine sediment metagenome TaxID=412755 RepID=A0A0F9SYY6_9ZZZZ
MTLTELLRRNHYSEDDIVDIKYELRKWLKEMGLPDYDTIGKGGAIFSATDSLRELLVTLVDEP